MMGHHTGIGIVICLSRTGLSTWPLGKAPADPGLAGARTAATSTGRGISGAACTWWMLAKTGEPNVGSNSFSYGKPRACDIAS
jgi:hypothetical protein